MKKHRQNTICRLVEEYEIKTQEELTSLLQKMGIETTQATVSRDIKELNLVKKPAVMGDYKYALSSGAEDLGFTPKLRSIFKECVKKIDIAQNMVVIRTISGMGNAAAYGLDAIRDMDIVGTLAGDDTIFVVLRTNEDAEKFRDYVSSIL